MRTSSGGLWIICLLLLGPIATVLLIHLAYVMSSPSCAEQWADWCGDADIIWIGLPRWSVTSKATELVHALVLLALFGWSSFQLVRAARTRRPLTPRMRYAVIAVILAWVVLFEI